MDITLPASKLELKKMRNEGIFKGRSFPRFFQMHISDKSRKVNEFEF